MIILFDCQIFGNMGNFELGLIYKNNRKYAKSNTLSKHIWQLKDAKLPWKIRKIPPQNIVTFA